MAGLVVLSLAILVVSASLLGFVITDYFDTNVGYRGAENRFVLDAMIHSNIMFLLLGYGVFFYWFGYRKYRNNMESCARKHIYCVPSYV